MSESLELQIAEDQLKHFEQNTDPVLREHYDAQDCVQCEAFLRQGIDAYEWLVRAEQAFMFADANGICEYSRELEQTVTRLYERWLASCTKANSWISRVEENGYTIENRSDFSECIDAAQDWIEQNEWYELARGAREANAAEDS